MDLTVIDETGTKTRQVSVPDGVAAGRIAARLVQMMDLPQIGADGQSLVYGFRREQTGRQIGAQETFAQAGVNEQDVLRLVALPPAQAPEVSAPGPPQTAVLSPLPPPPQISTSSHALPAGGRWTPLVAVAAIALAVALVGVGVAIAVGHGGKGSSSAFVDDLGTGTAPTTETTETAPDTTAEQATGETTGETAGETTTTAEGLLPAVSTQQMESEIQGMLRTWHEDVVKGEYHAAWELLSQRKRDQEEQEQGYAKWEKNQSTLRPYLNPKGLQVSIQNTEASSGVAQVEVTGMTWDQPGASCSEWSGITWVKYEDGGWRYDPGYSTTPQREHEWKSHYSELLGGSC